MWLRGSWSGTAIMGRGGRSPAMGAMLGSLLWFCICVGLLPLAVVGVPSGAAIESVPGFSGALPSKQYSGYVTVNETHGRELFYYFVESEGNPATDPVVLWLNGGPGCSSFDGFIYEHGPFKFEPAADYNSLPKLTLNPYAWSKVANVLYLDSPAGVGFSYSKTRSDYVTGDLQTALDTHAFLLKWFEEYPAFQKNPFFISGESYAGIYVPTLSRNVAHGIKAGTKPVINFKGYMVGNGVTDEQVDGDAIIPFIYGMGLISMDMYKDTQKACNGSYWNATDQSCIAKINDIWEDVAKINIYDILEPCYHPDSGSSSRRSNSRLPESFRRLGETTGPHKIRKRQFGRAYPLRLNLKPGLVPTWPSLSQALFDSDNVPCMNYRIADTWLNNASVRAALHAKSAAEIGPWELCTNNLLFYHDAGSMIPIHRELTTSGYRALIYSGDHDMCVPYTGSEAWTSSMGYKVTDHWRPWLLGRQVAGYTQGYDNNLTFATIKGSGHTVPEYKPAEALAFFQRFLAAKSL